MHYHQSTLPKHATITLPPQKHTLYNARVREGKTKAVTFAHHCLHRTKTNTLPHSSIRANAIRARFGLLPRLAKQTNLRKQVSQQPGIKRTTPTNHPAPSGPEKAVKALFRSHLEQKDTKKFGTTKKKQYLCTAFNSKAIFQHRRKRKFG